MAKRRKIKPARIAKVDEDKRLVFGWAYVTKQADGTLLIDKQQDFMDSDEELEKMAYDFVIDFGTGDVMHNEEVVAKLVESVVFTDEKVSKMGLDPSQVPTGWWVGFRVDDDQTWDLVKRGKLRDFSIGGRGIREEVNV